MKTAHIILLAKVIGGIGALCMMPLIIAVFLTALASGLFFLVLKWALIFLATAYREATRINDAYEGKGYFGGPASNDNPTPPHGGSSVVVPFAMRQQRRE